jgi:hypothetical protein
MLVRSGKETVLDLALQVAAFSDLDETATQTRNGEVRNEMAMTGAREFTVDETVRYAGSRGDPIRTALNFAGIQGLDDSRNDVVVRGNTPYGIGIQIEGVALMNSNHFATPGTNGGPLSKISFKCLDNSDFYSGAMPAEFGNSISGVFDLRLKSGNNKRHEQGIYFGVLGADLFMEGPLNKDKGSSYIFNYRRSVINVFMDMGLDLGTSAVPFYQDLNFKMVFPTRKAAEWVFWGITGNSRSRLTLSDDTETVAELYGDNDRDQFSESKLDVIGITYNKPINPSTFLKATVAYSKGFNFGNDDFILSRDTLPDGKFNPSGVRVEPMMGYYYKQDKYTLFSYLNRRLAKDKLLKVGFTAEWFDMAFDDSLRNMAGANWHEKDEWIRRWDSEEVHFLMQYFAQYKQEFGEKLQATFGFHGTYFTLGNGASLIEPRAGLKYNYRPGKTLSFGAGLYSQSQAPYLYYYSSPALAQSLGHTYNKDMGLTKTWHTSLGHLWNLSANLDLLVEAYFQYLYQIPVETQASAFSLINTGSGFSRVLPNELENTGAAYNHGLELSLQRFFDNGYSFLLNGAWYESMYRGSDREWRNTSFNGNYMANALATKEFDLNENSQFGIGSKITFAGGRRYGRFDEARSALERNIVWLNEGYNENKYPDYFRADLRLTYVVNRAKASHELAIDLLNIFNTSNVLDYSWAPGLNPDSNFALRQQIGFLPLFYYRLDF